MKKLVLIFISLTYCIITLSFFSACKNTEKSDLELLSDYHTVTFDTDGGNDIAPKRVMHGEKISAPEDPYKNGYEFDGWYVGDEKWSFIGYVVTEDTTLTAKWSKALGLQYLLNDEEYIVIGYNGSETDVYISSTHCGYPVTSIGDGAFFKCSNLTSVTIANGVANIGNNAFAGCANLTSINVNENNQNYKSIDGNLYSKDGKTLIQYAIGKTATTFTIPYGVINIGDYAFSECISLETINIPEGVEDIGKNCFYSCKKLKTVTIPHTVKHIGEHSFTGTKLYADALAAGSDDYSTLYVGKWLVAISDRLKTEITNVTSYSRRNSVLNGTEYQVIDGNGYIYSVQMRTATGILFTLKDDTVGLADGVFARTEELKKVYLPSSVKYVGDHAFYGAVTLWSFEVPDDGLLSIGEYAFCNCSKLESPSLGNRLKTIGQYAFYNCSRLDNNPMGESFLPDTLEKIGMFAFKNTKLWNKPDEYGIVYAGNWVVGYGGGNLATVTLKPGVVGISDYAFYDCENLYNIDLENTQIKRIGEFAFYNCVSLTSAILPNSLESIEERAFYNCLNLIEVKNNSNLNITEGSELNGYIAYYSKHVYSDGDSFLHNAEDIIFYEDEETVRLVKYIGNEAILTLPDNYNGKSYIISDYAFYNCKNLVSVKIPECITYIGDMAFYGCNNLIEIFNKSNLNVTEGSESNGHIAHYSKHVYSDGDSFLHNMNGLIFYEDEETARLVKYTGNEAILTLPDNYNGKNYSISNYAFYNCNSQMTVVIPENITSTEEFEGFAGIIVGFNDYTAELYGVIIIIDRSGSMDETLAVGTTRENRLWWAKQGAMACLDPDILSKTDYIGIMTLDSYNEIILPLTPYQQEAKILAAIDSIEEAGGGTIATNALNSARQQLLAQKNINKYHIIVITDGDFADLDTAIEAAQTNYANGITMSIVKIGESNTGTAMSLRLAAAGNGGDPDGNLTPYEKYVYRDDNRIVLNMREIIKNLR